ncbi:MAG: class I SAM-dependent methyltransferase [Peptostreptococcaceae bacterium]|nr:class I SAM-dependent methyltransferase [Peptostreptococcaceae bacterium]
MNESKEKLGFELNAIQRTMFLPLWGRFKESKKNDPLLYDEKAIEIINNIDFDFMSLDKNVDEYGALSWVIRAKRMDEAVKNFIKKHPKATIINIGAGLDTGFERVDNQDIMWYDLDLLDSIKFRSKFINETNRRKFIAKSVFDTSWFDEIEPIEDNILFLAAGVLMFFEEKELKKLFSNLASRFPNGEIFFDTLSSEGLNYANEIMKNAGMKENMLSWGIDCAYDMENWSKNIKVIDEFSYYKGIKRKSHWNKDLVSKLNMCDENKGANFYHLKFI